MSATTQPNLNTNPHATINLPGTPPDSPKADGSIAASIKQATASSVVNVAPMADAFTPVQDLEAGGSPKSPTKLTSLLSDSEDVGAQPPANYKTQKAGDASSTAAEPAPSSLAGNLARLGVAVLCGILFGMAVNKSGVNNATVLRNQFNFENLVMLKIFLTATATSIFTIALMHLVPSWKKQMKVTDDSYREEIGFPATLVGAFTLGVGMTVAGACPGTVWVQLGSGSLISIVTLAGGLVAGIVHGLIAHRIKPYVMANPIPKAKACLGDLAAPKWRTAIGVGIAAFMAAAIVGLNYIKASPDRYFPTSEPFEQPTWNPAFAGIFIGVLQLPLTLALEKNVGSASTMQTLASMLFVKTEKYEQLNKMKWGMKRWWQVVYLVAAMGSSALASHLSSGGWYTGDDITPVQAFVGGFLTIFGARVAGGCTSGHGISGAGHLAWRSFGAIGAMFAGAIAARYALNGVF